VGFHRFRTGSVTLTMFRPLCPTFLPWLRQPFWGENGKVPPNPANSFLSFRLFPLNMSPPGNFLLPWSFLPSLFRLWLMSRETSRPSSLFFSGRCWVFLRFLCGLYEPQKAPPRHSRFGTCCDIRENLGGFPLLFGPVICDQVPLTKQPVYRLGLGGGLLQPF